MDYTQHLDILANCCKQVFESMTATAVVEVTVREDQRGPSDFKFAQVIDFEHLDHHLRGRFVLGFPSKDMAVTVASAIAESSGLEEVTEFDEDAMGILQEFINTVVGRVLSGWDRLGLPTRFSPPRTVLGEELAILESAHTQAHLVVLSLDVGYVIFHVSFTEAVDDSLSGRTVLVADDSKIIQKLLTKTLEEAGLKVLTASDGREAVQKFMLSSPDLTIMDQVMPEMTGLEAVAEIHGVNSQAPILMLTSSSRKDEVLSARSLGVLTYLLKPVQPARLLQAVREVLLEQET